jgi:LEA14-like dessication related protein
LRNARQQPVGRPVWLPAWCVMLAWLLSLGGCAVVPRAPEVGFAGVEWLGAGELPGEQKFMLRLRLRNANETELRVEALQVDLELDGIALAHGRSEEPLVIPGGAAAELALRSTGRLDKAVALWAQARLARREMLPYRITGSATVGAYGVLPIDRRGEVSLATLGRLRKGSSRDDKPL